MDDPLLLYSLLCASAALAGVLNAVAGGGTLLTFPALALALTGSAEAAVVANATSTVCLMPGSFAGAWGYRKELAECKRWLYALAVPSLLGGTLGAWLVITLDARHFKNLVPWLILAAAALFLVQPRLARWLGIGQEHAAPGRRTVAGVVLFQFLVGVYGGYFGAGIGILMLSSLALMGLGDIHRMNALKAILAALMNGAAVAVFLVDPGQPVRWQYALPMAAAAGLGGYAGARLALRLNRNAVRWIVIVIGFGLAAYYFYERYAPTPGGHAVAGAKWPWYSGGSLAGLPGGRSLPCRPRFPA